MRRDWEKLNTEDYIMRNNFIISEFSFKVARAFLNKEDNITVGVDTFTVMLTLSGSPCYSFPDENNMVTLNAVEAYDMAKKARYKLAQVVTIKDIIE